jgi:hypothetical protein
LLRRFHQEAGQAREYHARQNYLDIVETGGIKGH